ncbi:MAG TPA: DUF488 family protein [Anaerolineae bacterium]|nr:DUF488 family protein [Anaerolineae bacterium]
MIRVKPVYEPAEAQDGLRFLVDRLWPRGLRKELLQLENWLREAAPSDQLRHWYGHEPTRWPEFQKRYADELDSRPEAWVPLLEAARSGDITLLYSSKTKDINNAVALKAYLEQKLGGPGPTQGAS